MSDSKPGPLWKPPQEMRPDRMEVMTPIGSGQRTQICPGIHFECLVGAHNQARNLTTGNVTFDPGAELPYHTHTFSESITLLAGQAALEIEGRRYTMGVLDNVTIPRGLAHCVTNLSESEPAVIHIVMATDSPTRTLVEPSFTRRVMADDSTGVSDEIPGSERVTRHQTAKRYEAGPNTSFIDYFNSDLMPGIEMCGGYGQFSHQGRLPAHVHDFDESICIIQGVATCIVEGRRYSLSDCNTALQPRGRVHYFINDTPDPMAMLWAYAGPMPERIVVDQQCATVEGDPWQ
jgi:quercetin dioxygenase-like cupin family protein